jgi:hypothetical protein
LEEVPLGEMLMLPVNRLNSNIKKKKKTGCQVGLKNSKIHTENIFSNRNNKKKIWET